MRSVDIMKIMTCVLMRVRFAVARETTFECCDKREYHAALVSKTPHNNA